MPPKRKYIASRDYGTRKAEIDQFKVRFGTHKATIYRRKDSDAGTWHFRLYVSSERLHYRKSLKTIDKRDAVKFAEQEIVNILAKQQNGQAIKSPTFAEAVRSFHLKDEQDKQAGVITPRTVLMHNHYIAMVTDYVRERFPTGTRTRLSAIDGRTDFADYLDWRLKRSKVRRDTVRAELVGIRMVFKHAQEKGLCTAKSVPVWDFKTGEMPRRARMADDDYYKVLACMKAWTAKAEGDVEIYNRHLLQHIFLLIAATGMRTGEVLGLRNKDVENIARDKHLAVIRIRAETTKVRKERRITVSPSFGGKRTGGVPINYLVRWIDRYQIHKKPDDFVFALFTKGDGNCTYSFYRSYASLRETLKQIGMEWWDAYHNRHYYCTQAIKAGHPLALIAVSCGNSVSVIEKTYSHALSEQTSLQMAQKRVVRIEGGGYEVVTSASHEEQSDS